MNDNQRNSNGDKIKKRDEGLFYISCDFVRLVSLFTGNSYTVFSSIFSCESRIPRRLLLECFSI